MRPHPISLITLTLTLLLAACVPIPPAPPPTAAPLPTPTPAPAAETKAGFSDLASGFAKIDQSDDVQQYAQLLDEIDACMQAARLREEVNADLSDSEIVAVTIYFAGLFSMAQLFASQFESAFPQNSPVGDGGEIDSSTYQLLEMALSACQPSEPE